MYQYQSVKTVTRVDGEEYVTYGIRVTGDKTENYIYDVFIDDDTAERFVKTCTDAQLDPVHIFDVLEDMFGASEKAVSGKNRP